MLGLELLGIEVVLAYTQLEERLAAGCRDRCPLAGRAGRDIEVDPQRVREDVGVAAQHDVAQARGLGRSLRAACPARLAAPRR